MASNKPSILIVEDDPWTREQLGDLLAGYCREIHLARDGEQGLNMYREVRPDIVITDVLMPVMSGWDMTRKIREMDSAARIVVITAYSDTDNLKESDCISVQYVFKPVDIDNLIDVIGRMHTEKTAVTSGSDRAGGAPLQ